MSEKALMLPGGGALPAHLQNSGKKVATGLVVTKDVLPRISIRGGKFRFVVDGEETLAPAGQPLNIIIVGAAPMEGSSKIFYEGAYTPGETEAPDCCSSDGITPDGFIETPQSASCHDCPQNIWGTAKKQDGSFSKGKACRDTKTLYAIPGVPGKERIERATLFQFRVPTTSLKSLSQLGHALEKHGLETFSSIISMTMDESTEWPQVSFGFAGYLDEPSYNAAKVRAESDEVRYAVEGGGFADPTKKNEALMPEVPAHLQKTEGECCGSCTGGTCETKTTEAAPDTTGPALNTREDDPPLLSMGDHGFNSETRRWQDVDGAEWNPKVHATKSGTQEPSYTKGGKFVARRGAKAEAAMAVQTAASGSGVQTVGTVGQQPTLDAGHTVTVPPLETEPSDSGSSDQATNGNAKLNAALQDWLG